MIDVKKIGKIAQYLHQSVPKLIDDVKEDLNSKIKKILIEHIHNLNFITRKEFDIQFKILEQIQENLRQMQLKINKLESISPPKISDDSTRSDITNNNI